MLFTIGSKYLTLRVLEMSDSKNFLLTSINLLRDIKLYFYLKTNKYKNIMLYFAQDVLLQNFICQSS